MFRRIESLALPHRMEEASHRNGDSSGNGNVGVSGANLSTHYSQEPDVPATSSTVTRPRPPPTLWYRVNLSLTSGDESNYSELREEAWSCVVVLLTFWFFASMTLILGFYGSLDLSLGPNSSCLLRANSFFVQEIKVRADNAPGPMLYGFSRSPPMNVENSWLQVFKEHITPNTHKEWVYQLNEGSEMSISYSISGSSPVTLVIAEGRENLVEWIEDPSYPNTTLSWNTAQGNGSIHQKIFRESEYYIAVGNLLQDVVEVNLELEVHALLYNTTDAYYQCDLNNGLCVLKLFVFGSNAAILTTPSPKVRRIGSCVDVLVLLSLYAGFPLAQQLLYATSACRNIFFCILFPLIAIFGDASDNWYMKVSYGPRWVTYFIASGALTIIVLLVFKFMSHWRSTGGDRIDHQTETLAPERTPLIPDRDDVLSCGSSYDSASNDEEVQGDEASGSVSSEIRSSKECEIDDQHRLCIICFDAPKDSFFLPCGHCAACFACGTRIVEELGTCPICNRKMKKIRRIFTV